MEAATGIFDLNQNCPVAFKLSCQPYLGKGAMAASSGQQVEKIIRIGKELGLEPATPEEAREMLGLKGIEKVRY